MVWSELGVWLGCMCELGAVWGLAGLGGIGWSSKEIYLFSENIIGVVFGKT